MWTTYKLTDEGEELPIWIRWSDTLRGAWIKMGKEGEYPTEEHSWFLNRKELTAAARDWLATVERWREEDEE